MPLSLALAICGLIASLSMLVRVELVSRERLGVLMAVHAFGLLDIMAGKSPDWRLEYYESVSFEKMLFQFWWRVDSFYDPNHPALQPSGTVKIDSTSRNCDN